MPPETGFNFQKNEEALKAEYQKDKRESNGGGSQGVPLLFLKKGITQVRILPEYKDGVPWFREIKEVFTKVDGVSAFHTSPDTYGDPCPFKEEGQRLYKERTEESIEAAKSLRPKSSFLFNAICYTSPDGDIGPEAGVVVLKAGTMVKRALLDLDQDAAGGYGNITDLKEGFDIRIERTGDGLNTEYVAKAIPQRTNIIEKLESMGLNPSEILNPIDLDELFPAKSYDELKKVLNSVLGKKEDTLPPVISGNDSVVPNIPAPPEVD